MVYNNREYPHPVLGIENAIKGKFNVHLSVKAGKDTIKIEPVFDLENMDIISMIQNGQALFATQVYCRSTMYRSLFKSESSVQQKIIIPTKELRNEVQLDFFVCAAKDIKDYCNSQAHADYNGVYFQLGKGEILAYGGQGVFHANKTPEELKAISSFMQIEKTEKENGPIQNSYHGEKIIVQLSKNDYEKYRDIAGHQYAEQLLHSSVVLPALMDAIEIVKDPTSEFSDNSWFKILQSLVEEKSKGNDNALFSGQKILDNPLNRTFKTIDNLVYNE
ncbi:hypothetical protein [Altibacter sp. HG106]|uniref:hypothetical protein n=1 Tax=Altibacter sp. HG106 TaxID=3023937 RepID=UPI0023500FC9|nr:hypothetical protein [Altibacter sp. HG106]MDC7993539.1 hypothetical protein [Altibacter sp. HG106]